MAKKKTKPVDPLRLARQAVIEVLQLPDTTASEKIAAANFIEKITARDKPEERNDGRIDLTRCTPEELAELDAHLNAHREWKERVRRRLGLDPPSPLAVPAPGPCLSKGTLTAATKTELTRFFLRVCVPLWL